MIFETWASEPFLREVEINKRVILLSKLIHEYSMFRNIEVKEAQKISIVEYIIENQIHVPFLKLCTIKWAFDKFTDTNNHNISAYIVYDLIKKAYQSEVHKQIIKRWDSEDQKNRIAPMTEAQKQDMKREARLVSWNIVVDIVKSGKQEFNNLNWINAIKHLAFEIGFIPEKMDLDHFHDMAMGVIHKEIESDKNNPSLSREDQKKSLKDSLLIVSKQIQGTDIESRINNLRQRLICEDYIKNKFLNQ
jgi:hypothetical protein